MLQTLIMMSANPQIILLHLASEMLENPRSHGESKIQIPIAPSTRFSITLSILGARER